VPLLGGTGPLTNPWRRWRVRGVPYRSARVRTWPARRRRRTTGPSTDPVGAPTLRSQPTPVHPTPA